MRSREGIVTSPETKSALRLLVVHSSAELYGSDRSLLDFVSNRGPGIEVTVILPEYGVLVPALEKAGAKVAVGEVGKISRGMLSPKGMLATMAGLVRSLRFLKSLQRREHFDLVYSNTIAVLGGAVFARFEGLPHVWHVREILANSIVVGRVLRFLVEKLSRTVICNSQQTLAWIKPERTKVEYHVVFNGFDVPLASKGCNQERERLGVAEDDLLFVLVGRINAWKGQKLLVEAFSIFLAETDCRACLAIVGSAPPGQEYFEAELKAFVAASGVADRVRLVPYRSDIEAVWTAADVVMVPSTDPEPFGRVAIEAMAFERPVIAAAHGGLLDIVADQVTGLLVEPRSSRALATAMRKLAGDPELRKEMGIAGRARQQSMFSVSGYAKRLVELLHRTNRQNNCVLYIHQS